MPAGEEMFKFHGYSGPCPKPPLPRLKSLLRACIAIDAWKLPIFERHLKEGRFVYEKGPGLTPETLHLYVNGELWDIEAIARAANTEAVVAGKDGV